MPPISVDTVLSFAEQILRHYGLVTPEARAVAATLVEGNLLGHPTHGLAKLPGYVELLKAGGISRSGDIQIVADSGASFAWDAHRRPGPWVVKQAIEKILARSSQHPIVTATIANCSHIGCLQTYLERIARHKLIGLLMASDPGVRSVAPFGGIDAVLGPNPIAVCVPTLAEPILIDLCTSAISNAGIRTAAQNTSLHSGT